MENQEANNNYSTLKNLALRREGERHRESSWDRTGGNNDFIRIKPGETAVVAHIKGAGCIQHIWMTCGELLGRKKQYYLRKMLIRMYWDEEEYPSVEVPLGDFFGLGHAETKNFHSAPLSMAPEYGRAMNCFFAMPYAKAARIEVTNHYENTVRLYFYIDYETYDRLSDRYLRFHATWRRENPCKGITEEGITNEAFQHNGKNLTGEDNYVILEAEGEGHYVGCHLDIFNLRITRENNWYGEGDDMIFIDGDVWPPQLHGTGTEDYFNTAWAPIEEFSYPYYGIVLAGGPNWTGKISLYRYHIEDPIMFKRSIRVTIEHGHNNNRSDDYSSTAYWYQTEPHKPFHPMPYSRIKPQNVDELKKYLDVSEEEDPTKIDDE